MVVHIFQNNSEICGSCLMGCVQMTSKFMLMVLQIFLIFSTLGLVVRWHLQTVTDNPKGCPLFFCHGMQRRERYNYEKESHVQAIATQTWDLFVFSPSFSDHSGWSSGRFLFEAFWSAGSFSAASASFCPM